MRWDQNHTGIIPLWLEWAPLKQTHDEWVGAERRRDSVSVLQGESIAALSEDQDLVPSTNG